MTRTKDRFMLDYPQREVLSVSIGRNVAALGRGCQSHPSPVGRWSDSRFRCDRFPTRIRETGLGGLA